MFSRAARSQKAGIEGFRAPRRVEYRIHASTAPPMPNMMISYARGVWPM
jgi:hypothetical protein